LLAQTANFDFIGAATDVDCRHQPALRRSPVGLVLESQRELSRIPEAQGLGSFESLDALSGNQHRSEFADIRARAKGN
jgi:hypothetical protein